MSPKTCRGFTDTPLTVVGVVANVRLIARHSDPDHPVIYVAQAQRPSTNLGVVLRSEGDPTLIVAALRKAVRAMDADIALFDVLTLNERIDANLAGRRGMNITLATFAICALLRTAVGLIGSLALVVSQRSSEFGVRIALGAAIGLVAAFGLMQAMTKAIADLQVADPAAYLAAALAMLATAALASWVPARRAARIELIQALRGD